MSRTWTGVAAAAALAVLVGALAPALSGPGTSVKADPPPALYPDALVAPLAGDLAAQEERAVSLFAAYRAGHPGGRDDAAFGAWAAGVVPPPAPAAQLVGEMAELQRLQRTRTAPGVRAATWLEVYGKKAVWKTYLKDVQETAPPAQDRAAKAELKHALTLATHLTKQLQAAHSQPAPYVSDPALRPDKAVHPGQRCPCSYPSKHAATSQAAVTVLGALDPHRAAEYRWMGSEVAYSRLLMAGHYRSDLLTGALLGDLVGLYELSLHPAPRLPTSGRPVAPPTPPTPTP